MLGKFKESLKRIKSEGIIILEYVFVFHNPFAYYDINTYFSKPIKFFLSHIAKCKERSKVVRKDQWFRNHIVPMYYIFSFKIHLLYNVIGTYF